MGFDEMPLSQLLQNRDVFKIFEDEFAKGSTWLDVTALLDSDSTLQDLAADHTIPQETLEAIVRRIDEMIG